MGLLEAPARLRPGEVARHWRGERPRLWADDRCALFVAALGARALVVTQQLRPERGMVNENHKWIALFITTLGVLMASIDGSIVLIALPAIFRGIHLDPLLPSNTFFLLVDDPGLPHRHERVGREPGQTRRPLRPRAHVQPRLRRLHLLLAPAQHHLDDRYGRRDLVDRDAHLPRRRCRAPLGELGRHPHRAFPPTVAGSPSGSTRRRRSAARSSASCSAACWPP